MATNLYRILGVTKDATADQIKQANRYEELRKAAELE
jgi:DnaJ-class molecular chaperone